MHVKLEEAKNYLRVDSADDDALIESFITTAVILVKEISRLDNETLADYAEMVHTAELYAIAYLSIERKRTIRP